MVKTAGDRKVSDSSSRDDGASTALLSNGRYSLLVTAAGAGYATWRNVDVTRWREDPTRDCWGQFCYVRDLSDGRTWSIGRQPLFPSSEIYEYSFHGDRAEFRCRNEDIEISWTVCVAPDADAEVRLLTIVNHGQRKRSLEFTSYAEICLNDRRADMAHPAFAKLFVETSYDGATGALFARRRPRAAGEAALWAVHVSSSTENVRAAIDYETDRAKFLGRGRTPADPIILGEVAPLSKTVGPVLDPVFSLRRLVDLEPGATARLSFVTGASDSQAAVQAIAERYSTIDLADQALPGALSACRKELAALKMTSGEVSLFNRLVGNIVFADAALRDEDAVRANRLGRTALWAFGISGDLPIVLARVSADEHAALINDVLRAQDFARHRGLQFDLVIFDEAGGESSDRLSEEIRAGSNGKFLGKPGGIFVLSDATVSTDQLTSIAAAARIVLNGAGGSLADQLKRRSTPSSAPARRVPPQPPAKAEAAPSTPIANLSHWNEFGGFSPDGREYVIIIDGENAPHGSLPPAPWTNVIANPEFGCLTTEAGLGYSWAGNSQMNRLTPWSNDPVSDAPGEVVYVRDEESGEIWTPTPLPLRPKAVVTVHHGQGYSRYVSDINGFHHELTVHVPLKDPLKIMRLSLRNDDSKSRRLTVTHFAEWVLGTHRENAPMQVVCERDIETGAILARNAWAGDFAGKLAFAAAGQTVRSATADRTEFLGRHGSVSRPAALDGPDLAGRFGPLQDPCTALMVEVSLAPGESKEVVFVLGQAGDLEEVRRLVGTYARTEQARESLAAVVRGWDEMLGAIQVSTPDSAFDLMMNRWLPYQVLACRVWARTSNYQSGGAYGFRDQLQDVMALVHSAPGEARAQILRSAARQFEEGDVQHWWHPPQGVGVRTRITDDLYFLPLVVHHYVSTTGDAQLLDEMVPFVSWPVLEEDQEERFGVPEISQKMATVYDHCLLALEHGYRLGSHGLPLMGTGDWNDGMNKVGAGSKGESVWNGWFFVTVLDAFSTIADSRGDDKRAAWCRERAEALRVALEDKAWDGAWYLRAYFDDGTPLGSHLNDECQIDAIPQAWAVISGRADAERAKQGMDSVHDRLVREQDGLIKLFDPPFDKGTLHPGYIKGYVPGIRENGGQYTHAATWVVLATALQGDGDRALKLWNLINPIRHAGTRSEVEHYKVEPYVVCADVYGAPPHVGRGGWTWYTGSAGWLYRVALEAILGFRRQGGVLRFEPCVPAGWPGYELTYRYGSATYHIRFDNQAGTGRGVSAVVLDGNPVADEELLLEDDGRVHDVHVTLGRQS